MRYRWSRNSVAIVAWKIMRRTEYGATLPARPSLAARMINKTALRKTQHAVTLRKTLSTACFCRRGGNILHVTKYVNAREIFSSLHFEWIISRRSLLSYYIYGFQLLGSDVSEINATSGLRTTKDFNVAAMYEMKDSYRTDDNYRNAELITIVLTN